MNRLRSFIDERPGGSAIPTMALRVGTLGSRFILTMYLAKSLGINDLGVFGLVSGLVSIVPPVTGFGLNYFLGREVVGLSLDEAALVVRNRLVITLLSLAAIVSLVPVPYLFGLAVPPGRMALVTTIVICETLSADLQTPLICLHMTLFANLLMFIQSAPWVFVGIGTVAPSLRTLDTVFTLWLLSNIVQVALLYHVLLRRIDLRRLLVVPLQLRRLLGTVRRGLTIYGNDLCDVGTVYLDRYIVGAMLSLHELGIFTLYWSMASAVIALVSSGIVRPATSLLIGAYADGDQTAWSRHFRKLMRNTVLAGVGLGLATLLMAWGVTTFLRIGDFSTHYPFLLLLLLAVTLRGVSYALNLALASRHMDREYSISSFIGVLLSIPLNISGLALLGLNGVALAGCITQAAVAGIKLRLLRPFVQRRRAGPTRSSGGGSPAILGRERKA